MNSIFEKFLIGTINQVTLSAALRRSNTYTENSSNKKRIEFREGLCGKLKELAKGYKNKVSENQHIENIKLLQKYSKIHKSVLEGGKIKFGIAQKALNLYLKLLWSQGKVIEPPHCPLDAIIINKLPSEFKCNWTELTKVAEYKKLMKAVKYEAEKKKKSIAKWELKIYQE